MLIERKRQLAEIVREAFFASMHARMDLDGEWIIEDAVVQETEGWIRFFLIFTFPNEVAAAAYDPDEAKPHGHCVAYIDPDSAAVEVVHYTCNEWHDALDAMISDDEILPALHEWADLPPNPEYIIRQLLRRIELGGLGGNLGLN
jgi:hypothetical protein